MAAVAGMVMQAQIYDAWKSIVDQVGYQPRCIYLTPQGRVFEQDMAKEYAREEDLIFYADIMKAWMSVCWKKS